MGGWPFGRRAGEEESTRFIHAGIDEGINYVEAPVGSLRAKTAPTGNAGQYEWSIGRAGLRRT